MKETTIKEKTVANMPDLYEDVTEFFARIDKSIDELLGKNQTENSMQNTVKKPTFRK